MMGYLKTTEYFHKIAITPNIEKHKITVVDTDENQISRTILIK